VIDSGTNRQNTPFGSRQRFEKAFPPLEDAVIEYRAARPGGAFRGSQPLPTLRLSMRNSVPITHCLSPNCRNGGYDFAVLVREMLSNGELERSGRISCAGRRGTELAVSCERWNDCSWATDFRVILIPEGMVSSMAPFTPETGTHRPPTERLRMRFPKLEEQTRKAAARISGGPGDTTGQQRD
jgi:hypothetical protein